MIASGSEVNGGTEQYTCVGKCYIHGLMDGKAIAMLERGEMKQRSFILR